MVRAKVPRFTEILYGVLPRGKACCGIIWAAGIGAEQMRMRCPAKQCMAIPVPAIDLDIQPMIGKTTSVTGVQFLKPERAEV